MVYASINRIQYLAIRINKNYDSALVLGVSVYVTRVSGNSSVRGGIQKNRRLGLSKMLERSHSYGGIRTLMSTPD